MTTDLLPIKTVAKILTCSEATIRRWHKAGIMPAPARPGGCVRWKASELEQWIFDGCPDLRKTHK